MPPTSAEPAPPASVAAAMMFDHDRIKTLVDDVGVMVKDGELDRAEHFFAEVRSVLVAHIRIEEDILFPALSARLGNFAGPVVAIYREHERLVATCEDVADALARKDAAAFRVRHRDLQALVSTHTAKEERVLHPVLDCALSLDEAQRVLASLHVR